MGSGEDLGPVLGLMTYIGLITPGGLDHRINGPVQVSTGFSVLETPILLIKNKD